MTNENWFLHFLQELITSFLMNTARPKKTLYCYWPGLMETLEMDCTKMDWALFSHPFNIQSGWKKNTWQPPYFLLPQFSNVTCPQFRSRMFCARKAWQIVFLCPRELKTHWGKPAQNIFNKKNLCCNEQNCPIFNKVTLSNHSLFPKWFLDQFPALASLCIKQCMSHSYNNY